MTEPVVWEDLPSTATPLNAATLNQMQSWMSDQVQVAQGFANDAAASAEQAAAPADDQIAALVATSGTATRTQLDAYYVPTQIGGTYAARPAANSVRPGTVYSATDIPEQYRSDGTTWTVTGPGGAEVGYAEITTPQTGIGATATLVTGLSVTFVAGERPLEVHFEIPLIPGGASSTWSGLGRLLVDGVNSASVRVNDASGNDIVLARTKRLTGLTAGSTHTLTVQAYTTVASPTSQVFGSAANPAYLGVKTL